MTTIWNSSLSSFIKSEKSSGKERGYVYDGKNTRVLKSFFSDGENTYALKLSFSIVILCVSYLTLAKHGIKKEKKTNNIIL